MISVLKLHGMISTFLYKLGYLDLFFVLAALLFLLLVACLIEKLRTPRISNLIFCYLKWFKLTGFSLQDVVYIPFDSCSSSYGMQT